MNKENMLKLAKIVGDIAGLEIDGIGFKWSGDMSPEPTDYRGKRFRSVLGIADLGKIVMIKDNPDTPFPDLMCSVLGWLGLAGAQNLHDLFGNKLYDTFDPDQASCLLTIYAEEAQIRTLPELICRLYEVEYTR